jgi:ring-1,2-phenylacetyl-CoA epoxidase subunit PaaE
MATTTPARAPSLHRLAVAKIEQLVEDAVALTFDVPAELREEYRFVQGQHLALSLPDSSEGIRRSYSICSPAPDGPLRVAIKRIPNGLFSTYVHTTLRVGDELDVLTPIGRFNTPLDPNADKHYAAVAAGSGITPILSIVATTLEVERESCFTLLYGNRTTDSTMFLEDLLDLKNNYPSRFALYPVFSREAQYVPLFDGRIDRDKLSVFLNRVIQRRRVDEWFLCGPQDMIETLRTTLVDDGVLPEQIHRELFHAGPTSPKPRGKTASASSQVTVILNGRATSFALEADGASILDAALAARPDAPYACKGGVCGTCRAHLAEGEVEMVGGYALEPAEIAAGFVLACQSHPRTPQVTLDFDS